jgi:PAS domain S-box-containing protein
MKTPLASEEQIRRDEIAGLERSLQETERRLRELKVGRADGARPADGQSLLLQEMQDKLSVSEARFRSLFSSSATGIAISTPRGTYLEANAAYCQMLGYTEAELKCMNFSGLTHPDDLNLNLKWRDEILSGQRESFSMEKRYLKKSGEIVWARHSVSAARIQGGEIGTLMVIAEDITERKLAEEARAQSEERVRLITNLVPHGIFAKDAAGRHIFANPALAELAGCTPEDMLGKTDFDLVADKAQAEAYRADDQAVMQSGKKMVISEELRTDLSGRTRVLQTIKVPFTLAETGEPAVLGVCMDITERKRIDARFRRLMDSNMQGVIFWNTSGRVFDANDEFLHIVGYSREDLMAGRVDWVALTPPEFASCDQLALQQIAETGVSEPYEKEYIRQDGSRVAILIGSAIFQDNLKEGVSFVLDVTERKKLEQQFLRAQRMESVGTLAGGIAHDINNILTPILLSIGLLKKRTEDPVALEILDTIEGSAGRGADIVRQVLSFARGVEGQRTEIHPKLLLHEMEHMVKDTFPKNIRIQFSISEDISAFLGDPTQMHQILLNLCLNARDAMPDGGTLIVNAENCYLDERCDAMGTRSKAGRYVKISVTDSGTGIPPNIVGKIFEPFFTTKDIGKGTGLGLSTVMAIVKSHQGIVNVYSEPGRGTTFRVYLWAMENSFEGKQKQTQQAPNHRGNGETILLVDDEPSILKIARRNLEAFGYRTLTAQDGVEALAIYERRGNEIAAVLTDTNMPIMDGEALIGKLLQINPTVRIVKVSGFSSHGSDDGLPHTGVVRFLAKPYTAATLVKAIAAVLEETKGEAS